MVEFTQNPDATFRMGFAGDTYNTAVYLHRAAHGGAEVHYVTATGDDWLSETQLTAMRSEGLIVDALRIANASPSLYLVSTDKVGERTFTYYREASPVRRLFLDVPLPSADSFFASFDMVYFSAITLQMLAPQAREFLWDALGAARASGTTVAFDSNYRARGWANVTEAVQAVDRSIAVTDIALPSLSDEQMLHCGSTGQSVIDRYRQGGVREVVVKDGAGDCLVYAHGSTHHFPTTLQAHPVDTTGAGDSFNAAYLLGRILGHSVEKSVGKAHRLAGRVIQHPGAIISRNKSGK
ncbi:sugar kinase [Glaciihabitans sp. INWT7]|uniref:sugar kinase n=1 Tax=Glaciihabitans sp. INWT7 TaxID=2596912 RepID=UPI00162678C8